MRRPVLAAASTGPVQRPPGALALPRSLRQLRGLQLHGLRRKRQPVRRTAPLSVSGCRPWDVGWVEVSETDGPAVSVGLQAAGWWLGGGV